jgi:hypothetical protein
MRPYLAEGSLSQDGVKPRRNDHIHQNAECRLLSTTYEIEVRAAFQAFVLHTHFCVLGRAPRKNVHRAAASRQAGPRVGAVR